MNFFTYFKRYSFPASENRVTAALAATQLLRLSSILPFAIISIWRAIMIGANGSCSTTTDFVIDPATARSMIIQHLF